MKTFRRIKQDDFVLHKTRGHMPPGAVPLGVRFRCIFWDEWIRALVEGTNVTGNAEIKSAAADATTSSSTPSLQFTSLLRAKSPPDRHDPTRPPLSIDNQPHPQRRRCVLHKIRHLSAFPTRRATSTRRTDRTALTITQRIPRAG